MLGKKKEKERPLISDQETVLKVHFKYFKYIKYKSTLRTDSKILQINSRPRHVSPHNRFLLYIWSLDYSGNANQFHTHL